jgi:hypothetical protein
MMLKDRIASLRGALVLDSTTAGTRLDICLPLAPHRGHHAVTFSAR